jgi:hypothetical protein
LKSEEGGEGVKLGELVFLGRGDEWEEEGLGVLLVTTLKHPVRAIHVQAVAGIVTTNTASHRHEKTEVLFRCPVWLMVDWQPLLIWCLPIVGLKGLTVRRRNLI